MNILKLVYERQTMTQTETVIEPIKSLRVLRLLKGWRQEDLAKKIKVPVRTIRAWEQGKTTPRPITVAGIREFVRRHR